MSCFDPDSQYQYFGSHTDGAPGGWPCHKGPCDRHDHCGDPCDPHCPGGVGPLPPPPRPDRCACACVQYFSHPDQVVPSGGNLIFSRSEPDCDGPASAPSDAAHLPCGLYLVTYAVNASASLSMPLSAGPAERAESAASEEKLAGLLTSTLGIAPKLNGVPFPRGGSFATIPFSLINTYSTTLASTFLVPLRKAVNTLGFYNTGASILPTEYQLLNITVSRVD